MEEVQVRRSRRVSVLAAVVGVAGLAVTMMVDFVRTPFTMALCVVAILVGLFGAIDRRVKLGISDGGVYYSEWGPSVTPWLEFSGFRWKTWRGQPYLQLVPRRPLDLVVGFSRVGKINHRSQELLRIPRFSIAVNALDLSNDRLEELIARHLPNLPAL